VTVGSGSGESTSGLAPRLKAYLCRAWRVASDARLRSETWLRLFPPAGVHQFRGDTLPDRYPEVFSLAAQLLRPSRELRLLSFGCSTGEEVFSLRSYFPDANIVGVEINPWSLRVARARNRNPQNVFLFSTPEAVASHGPYDAIFCMAVLQRTENVHRPSSAELYPFARFEAQLVTLDAVLHTGGLLVIDLAHYRFRDTVIAPRYRAVCRPEVTGRGQVKFDRQNRALPRGRYAEVIWVKRR
jgi:hypothetical protein